MQQNCLIQQVSICRALWSTLKAQFLYTNWTTMQGGKTLIQHVYVFWSVHVNRFDPLCGSVYTLLLIRGCLWCELCHDVHFQASHALLMSVATLTITIRVYLWCSGWSYWAGCGWALIGVKVLHVECFSSLSTWVECTLHTVACLKWFCQMDGWMPTPWNHLYKRTFHWAWHFSMDPVHVIVASHFLNSHSTKGSKILLVLGVDHPNCMCGLFYGCYQCQFSLYSSSDTTSTIYKGRQNDWC